MRLDNFNVSSTKTANINVFYLLIMLFNNLNGFVHFWVVDVLVELLMTWRIRYLGKKNSVLLTGQLKKPQHGSKQIRRR